ncbi:hypothetical protein [Nocardia sp. NPDC052112]|uniref:hypothetical protein n=1 Tax=Nocardia sp. NPDC052112 TaxID=3155646 RepID=UPI0034496E4B
MNDEYEKAQNMPIWRQWFECMDSKLSALSELVPDMPADPYTADGLKRVMAVAHDVFPTVQSVSENAETADLFARFIGEVFRRNFDGRWFNFPYHMAGLPDLFPAVRFDWDYPGYVIPAHQLSDEIELGPEREAVAWVYGNYTQDHAEWVAAGRPAGEALKKWKPELFA